MSGRPHDVLFLFSVGLSLLVATLTVIKGIGFFHWLGWWEIAVLWVCAAALDFFEIFGGMVGK